MYNEILKKKYLENRKNNLSIYINVFNNVGVYEELLGKDAAEFSIGEILDYYKFISTTSNSVLNNINSTLKDYTSWYEKNYGLKDSLNHYIEIDNVLIRQCMNETLVKSRIITEEDFKWIISNLKNACDKFIFYCYWEGIRGTNNIEIFSSKLSDFDGNIFTTCTGRKIKVSDELVIYANESNEEVRYLTYGSEKEYNLIKEDKIVKFTYQSRNITDKNRGRNITTRTLRILETLGYSTDVSVHDIINSGIINYIKQLAKKDRISSDEAVRKYSKEIKYKYPNYVEKSFLLKYENYI